MGNVKRYEVLKPVIIDDDTVRIEIILHQYCSQKDLIRLCQRDCETLAFDRITYGRHVLIYGKITNGMCIVLGHALAYMSESVDMFDYETNDYVKCSKY